MNQIIKLLSLCGTLALMSGCAFTKTETAIQTPISVVKGLNPSPGKALRLGDVRDTRTVGDSRVLLQKSNAYGHRTSGAYLAPKPVVEIMREALTESLTRSGIALEAGSRLELKAELQEFRLEVIQGFWTAQGNTRLQVRFELVDNLESKTIWRDTLIGRSSVKAAIGTKEHVAKLFEDAAADLLGQLLKSPDFANQLR